MYWALVFLSIIAEADTTKTFTLKPGDSIDKILQLSGLPDSVCSNIIIVLKTKIDMRKCIAGEKLYISKRQNRFISIKYKQREATLVIDSALQIYQLPEHIKLLYLKGTIKHGSLWNSLIAAGATPKLIYEFANEVFAWDIDFNTETQDGDGFEVLATAKYINENENYSNRGSRIFKGEGASPLPLKEDRFIGHQKILLAQYITDKRKFVGIKDGNAYYNLDGKSLRKAFLKSPVSFIRISSGFSLKRLHPVLHKWLPHKGVDYAAPTGTPVRSIGDGKVISASKKRGFGNLVIIQHPNGYKSQYGHLASFNKGIRKNKQVGQGEIIGRVGSTGLSTGPHLDFRMQKGETYINPLKLCSPPAEPLTGKELKEYQTYTNKLLTLINGLNTLKKLHSLQIFISRSGSL